VSAAGPGEAAKRCGRPPCCPPELAILVVSLRLQGLTYAAISDALNSSGVPTPAGRPKWQRSYVDRLLHTRCAIELMERAGVV
jgi:hypothetical protein